MKLQFKHDCTWECWGDAGQYVIEVCDDGEFVATYTDDITGRVDDMPNAVATLKEARDWCEQHEAQIKRANTEAC